ncbi:MAG: pyridoxamine 5'-phosphate oxidase family protein [Oscillospiraceae bacterium]|nr:pyridoxamine 5'-phosphate oxidase family protein [Oscillospiraceae bacterium]
MQTAGFRPLIRQQKQLPEAECIALLKHELRGVLSVIGDGGYPYGMPMNHWYCEADGKLYFHGGKEGHKIDALRRCDQASFCVYDSGVRAEGDWALTIRSVIVFGRITLIDDPEQVIRISRQLCGKFTQDEAYIENEIRCFGSKTLCLALTPEHICGKRVSEK